jgi:hypothetical protein
MNATLPILSPEDRAEIRRNALRLLRARRVGDPESYDEASELEWLAKEDGESTPSGRHVKGDPRYRDLNTISSQTSDDFQARSSRIRRVRRYRARQLPKWATSNERILQLLTSAFPRMHEDSEAGRRQRDDAARWSRVIQLYFRMGYTARDVAGEMYGYTDAKHCLAKVRGIIQTIQRKVKGLATNTAKHRGRPAKNPPLVQVL